MTLELFCQCLDSVSCALVSADIDFYGNAFHAFEQCVVARRLERKRLEGLCFGVLALGLGHEQGGRGAPSFVDQDVVGAAGGGRVHDLDAASQR